MHRIRRGVASLSALHWRAHPFIRQRGKCGYHALRERGPQCAAEQCRDRPWRSNPGRSGCRRRSRTRCEAVSNHPARHLSHYAADDRQAERMTSIRVLSVASEIYPMIKTGGLADVVGALPAALKAYGIETRTLVPGYPDVINALSAAEELVHLQDFYGGPTRVLGSSYNELDLLVLDAPHLFARPGNPYVTPDGADWPDNGLRFAALSRMAAEIGQGAIPAFVPDVVHAHDWQAGLTHAFLHYSERPRPGTIMTVHNLAYQGKFARELLSEIGLPPESLTIDGVEYFGGIGFLKAGLQFADRITTVSPTYAAEIRTPEDGMALDGLLRLRSAVVSGILNGIDETVWNPATDPNLVSRYNAARLGRRAPNKAALKERFGIKTPDGSLLFGVISRLSEQKGLDLLVEALPRLLALD